MFVDGVNYLNESLGLKLVQDKTRTGIHSAVVCATRRAVVFDSRAHLILQVFKNAARLTVIGNGEAADASKNGLTRLAWNSITCMLQG